MTWAWNATAASDRSCVWRIFRLEIAEPIDAANERCTVARSDHLPNVGRKVANSETDPALCRRVGIRSMDQANMVKRHLAWLKREHHGGAAIDVHRDLLTACQQIVRRERIAVRDLLELLRIRE